MLLTCYDVGFFTLKVLEQVIPLRWSTIPLLGLRVFRSILLTCAFLTYPCMIYRPLLLLG